MQLIDRALNALEILSQNMNGMSVTDLAEQLGIPASSTHRILSSLKGNHFVVQDEHTKKDLRNRYRGRKGKCADAGGTDAYAETGGKDRPECGPLHHGAWSCDECGMQRTQRFQYVYG